MANVIGVRFRSGSRMYFFDPGELKLSQDERVIVETARGEECGRVVMTAREVEDRHVSQPLRSVLRSATESDLAREETNRQKEKEAYKICREKIAERGLDMKLIRAEYTFDSKKLLFYFTADGRIDFRDLVKDLASVFRMRIELRQIGVRDEAKMLGGIGICGRPFCCSTFLSDFAPVSIKMAKEQNLSLNPTKISGSCGRLMCCLKNEQETYEYLLKRMPGVGDIVETLEGDRGKIYNVNVLRQTCRVIIEVDEDNKEMREYPVDELEVLFSKRKNKGKSAPKDIRELESRRSKAEREKALLEKSGRESGLFAAPEEDIFGLTEPAASEKGEAQEKETGAREGRKRGEREKEGRRREGRSRDGRGRDGREKKEQADEPRREGSRRRGRRSGQPEKEQKEQKAKTAAPEEKKTDGEQGEKKRRRRSRGRRRRGGEGGGQQNGGAGNSAVTPAASDHE